VIYVLLVDDDPALFNITKILLEKEGELLVDLCGSAPEAMEMLEEKDYDAIISDYDMPGMDGIEFFKELRKKGSDTPFVMFTGKGNENTVISALNCGINYYIKKGDNPKEVFSKLRFVIKDIANQKKNKLSAEEQIQKGDRHSSFYPDFILVADPDGIVTYADPYLERLLKLPEHSMQSRSLLGFVSPQCRERAQSCLFPLRKEELSEGLNKSGLIELDLLVDEGTILTVKLIIRYIPQSPACPAQVLIVGSSRQTQ
jgi:CheY-like chemotaxis protein